jgi:hypothetical protein
MDAAVAAEMKKNPGISASQATRNVMVAQPKLQAQLLAEAKQTA